MTNNVVVIELACASTSSSVADALQEEQFQVGLELDFTCSPGSIGRLPRVVERSLAGAGKWFAASRGG